MVSANTTKQSYGYFTSNFQNDMKEILIQQVFLRAGQDIGNQYYHLGQIGCPILLVAQNAIIKCQFPAYIYESLASNRYKNWCQMSGRLFAVFLDIIKTYCGLEQSIWGFSLPTF